MHKRNVLNSPGLWELRKHRRRVFLYKIFIFLFLISIICYCLVYISRDSNLNISEIKISGNKVIETSLIKEVVEKELAGNYLYFFPKTNFIIYPQNKIKTELENKFKRIKDIFVNDKNIQTLEISLTERTASYTWCGDTAENTVSADQKCYFMDEDGFIFDEAPYFSGEVYFKFFGPADIGTYFSEKNFKQIVYFKNTLVTMDLKPVSLRIIKDEGDVKILLSSKNKMQAGPYITFKIDSDYQNIIENLETALDTEPLLSNFKNKYSSLEYIDLRFGNKVYYKFK